MCTTPTRIAIIYQKQPLLCPYTMLSPLGTVSVRTVNKKRKRGNISMPTLSIFYGIIVYMYNEKGGKHNLPHIHAEYQDNEIVLSLEGEVLEGDFPKNKLKLLLAWAEIHKDDLYANWKLLSDGKEFFRIEPLR